nr:MAG TPA: hypothetical protein [Caudoviricetes sp.]
MATRDACASNCIFSIMSSRWEIFCSASDMATPLHQIF